MATTNLNEIAKEIAAQEGLKESMSIAQIKEVLKITLRYLKKCTVEELAAILRRQRE